MPAPRSAHDCIVVGGGPAGAWTARGLAEAGFDVLLVERRELPRDGELRTLLSPAARRQLPALPEAIVAGWVSRAEISDDGRELFRGRLRERDAFAVIRRGRFDDHLVHLAGEAGARVRAGCEVTGFEVDRGGVLVETAAGRFRTPVVVGADGARGISAETVPRHEGRRFGFLARVSESLAEPLPRDRAVVDFGAVPGGLAWRYPGGDGSVFAGVWAPLSREDVLEILDALLGRHGIYLHEDGVELWGQVVPTFDPAEPLHSGRFVFVGDAAGLVDPFTGEGIRWALRSGVVASRAISTHLRRNAPLDAYTEAVRATCYADLEPAVKLSRACRLAPRLALGALGRVPHVAERLADLLAGRLTYEEFLRAASRRPTLRLLQWVSHLWRPWRRGVDDEEVSSL